MSEKIYKFHETETFQNRSRESLDTGITSPILTNTSEHKYHFLLICTIHYKRSVITIYIFLCSYCMHLFTILRVHCHSVSLNYHGHNAQECPSVTFVNFVKILLLVCVSFTIIGQPRNSVLIRRV